MQISWSADHRYGQAVLEASWPAVLAICSCDVEWVNQRSSQGCQLALFTSFQSTRWGYRGSVLQSVEELPREPILHDFGLEVKKLFGCWHSFSRILIPSLFTRSGWRYLILDVRPPRHSQSRRKRRLIKTRWQQTQTNNSSVISPHKQSLSL